MSYFRHMKQVLLFAVPLLSLQPCALRAQVQAGNATGLVHTAVGIVLVPAMDPFPMSSSDTASIDVDADGANDLFFDSGNIHAFDADGSYNSCTMLQAGLEVAVDAPGGYVSKRLDLLDPVDASLNWRAYVNGGGNSMTLASELTDFGGQWHTTGGAEWLINGAVATQGYLAVRLIEPGDTLYGWVDLTSYVSQDSAWLQIDDFAIENTSTGISAADGQEELRAVISPNGLLLIQGGSAGILHITIRDLSGRLVKQVDAPAPHQLDLADQARGTYLVTVSERLRSRSFTLTW